MKWKYCLLSVILIFFSNVSLADNTSLLDKNLQATIDQYLKKEGKKEGITAVAATVAYPVNKELIKKTFVTGLVGYAPYDKEPVTKNNLFEIGSITKSFATMLILQLEAEGMLSIEDKIGRYFPQYPQWKDVTIKQLLNMTSGIPSYTKNEKFQKIIYGNIRAELSDEELLQYADPEKPIGYGKSRFDYSNTNYILAGLIVEAVTHHSFADELQKRLLDQPYPLKNTYYVAGRHWKSIRERIMPRMVHGYYYDDVTKKMVDVTDSNLTWAGPAGAMVSDTQDMVDWVQVLYHGLALPNNYRKKGLKELESVVSMRTGKPIADVSAKDPKGFGLGVGYYYDDKEGRFWVYEGSGMGYRMMYFWRPCNNITVVAVLNNKAGEAEGHTHVGDQIQSLVLNLYKKIIAEYPKYACKN